MVIKMVLLQNILTTNGIHHRIEYRRDRCAKAKRKPMYIMYFANLCNSNVNNHIVDSNNIILHGDEVWIKYCK